MMPWHAFAFFLSGVVIGAAAGIGFFILAMVRSVNAEEREAQRAQDALWQRN